ncbi:Uncharacterised protein [Bordetella pertussis]|nr:Uncharacterised protein [Bordetella pertussis]
MNLIEGSAFFSSAMISGSGGLAALLITLKRP